VLTAEVRIGRQNGLPFLTMAGRTHERRRLTRGRIATGFPVVSGQNAGYVDAQLKAYRAGERATDESYGQMMRGVVRNLNDEEIAAVSAYVQGLR
jgi:cytochrome c553